MRTDEVEEEHKNKPRPTWAEYEASMSEASSGREQSALPLPLLRTVNTETIPPAFDVIPITQRFTRNFRTDQDTDLFKLGASIREGSAPDLRGDYSVQYKEIDSKEHVDNRDVLAADVITTHSNDLRDYFTKRKRKVLGIKTFTPAPGEIMMADLRETAEDYAAEIDLTRPINNAQYKIVSYLDQTPLIRCYASLSLKMKVRGIGRTNLEKVALPESRVELDHLPIDASEMEITRHLEKLIEEHRDELRLLISGVAERILIDSEDMIGTVRDNFRISVKFYGEVGYNTQAIHFNSQCRQWVRYSVFAKKSDEDRNGGAKGHKAAKLVQSKLQFAYAMTAHKVQGSEYDVVMCIDATKKYIGKDGGTGERVRGDTNYTNIIYVQGTRAREELIYCRVNQGRAGARITGRDDGKDIIDDMKRLSRLQMEVQDD